MKNKTNGQQTTAAPESQRETDPTDRRVRLNKRFILTGLAAALVLAAGLHFVHGMQVERNADWLRDRADKFEQDGDHVQAIRELTQYVRFRPQDTEALVKLGRLVNQTAVGPKGWARAFLTFEEALRRQTDVLEENPEKLALRRELVQVAFKLRRFRDALTHVEILQKYAPQDSQLELWAGQCHEALGKSLEATKSYLLAVEHDVETVDHYLALVGQLSNSRYRLPRQTDLEALDVRPELKQLFPAKKEDLSNEVVADRLLAFLVQHGKPVSAAHRARAIYCQKRSDWTRAEQDIAKAFELAPDDIEVLLTAADIALAHAAVWQQDGKGTEAQAAVARAREYAERGLQQPDPDVRFYVTLARLDARHGELSAAEAHLRKGQEALPSRKTKLTAAELHALDLEFRWLLADLLITQAAMDQRVAAGDGSVVAAELEKRPELEELRKTDLSPPLLSFLADRMLLLREEWNRVSRNLEELRPQLRQRSDLIQRIDLMLGQCYEQLGNPDQRLDVFRRALKEDPLWVAGRLQLASALAASNRLEEALEEYRHPRVAGIPGVPLAIARLMILDQARRPAEQRDWRSVEQLLKRIVEQLGDETKIEALRLQAEVASQQRQFAQAQALLEVARDESPDDAQTWAALATLALRRDDWDEQTRFQTAEQLLQEAHEKVGDHVELRLVGVKLAGLQPASKARPALLAFEQNLAEFSRDDQVRLLTGIAEAYVQLGAQDEAHALWSRLAAENPRNLRLQLVRLHLALKDKTDLAPALAAVRAIEGPNGPNGNYFEAVMLLEQAAKDQELQRDRRKLEQTLAEPRALLNSAAKQRPYWGAVAQSLGDLDFLLGNQETAVDHYRKAISLGQRSREMLTRVVQYYQARGKADEADQVLREATDDDPTLLTGDLARMARDIAWQQQRFEQALELAKDVADKSGDFRDKIRSAHFLFARYQMLPVERRRAPDGERLAKEAESLFREAIADAPDKPAAWQALVVHLVRIGRTDEALAEIEKARDQLPSDPPHLAPLTLAALFEIAGASDQSEPLYEKAVEASPNDALVRMTAAEHYLRAGAQAKADEQLNWLLDAQHNAPQFAADWAQRIRALQQGASGSYEDLIAALDQLNKPQSGSETVSVANLRAQAALLARRNTRRDRLALIQVLERIAKQQSLTLDERLQLARLHEVTGNWKQAQALFKKILDESPSNGPVLFDYCIALMGRKLNPAELIEAESLVERIERLEPESFRSVTARAKLLALQNRSGDAVPLLKTYLSKLNVARPEQAFRDLLTQRKADEAIAEFSATLQRRDDAALRKILSHVQKLVADGDTEEALAVLSRYVSASDMVASVQTELVRVVGLYFEELGEPAAAEETLRDYVSRSRQPEAVLVLATFLARQQRIDEALDLCAAAWDTCPPVAVARASAGILRVGPPQPEQIQRVETAIDEAIRKSDSALATELMVRLADVQDFESHYSEAVAIYRAILKVSERNLTALNNLAWLLAYQPGGEPEALRLIDQAVRLGGSQAGLLDTRGVIRLRNRQPREAVNDLETAVAEYPSAVLYFHLAQARMANGNAPGAADAYRLARENGFDPKYLHPLELKDYQDLLKRLPKETAQP